MATGGALIGALRATLGLDTANFEAGTKRARDIAKRDATAIQKTMDNLKTGVAGLLGAATVGSLVAAGKRALEYASSLAEVAQQLGVTTEQLQVYRYAASQVGISNDVMDTSLAKLTKTIGEAAAGSKTQAETFRELGISVADANGRIYTAGEILPRLADALAKIKDPAVRARIETDLLGRAGQKLDTLLAGGSSAIEELTRAARDLGIVLSEKEIQDADKTADKISELNQVLEAKLASIVSENAAAIYDFASALERLIGKIPAALRMMENFRAKLTIVEAGAAQFNPLLLPSAKAEAQQRAKAASNTIFENNIADTLSKLPKFRTTDLLGQQAPTVGDGPLPTAKGGGGGRKGPKDRSAEIALRQKERYDNELDNLVRDEISLRADLITDVRKRAEIELHRVDVEQANYKAELDTKVKMGEILPEQAKRLELAKNNNLEWERYTINLRMEDDMVREGLETRQESLSLQSDALRADLSLATTQEERRRLQLQLLDIEYDRQRAALEAVMALNSSTEAEKKIAQARLDQLGLLKSKDSEGIMRGTEGPLEAYRREISLTQGQIDEKFQDIQVEGLKSLNDGLVEAIMNSKSLGDMFKSVADQIIADLLRIAIQQAIIKPLMSALGSMGGGGGDFGGEIGGSLPGLASGGSFMVGGAPGVDQNILSIGGIPRVRVGSREKITVSPANDRNAQPAVVQLVVGEGQMFEPRVRSISGDVSVQVVRGGAKGMQRQNRQSLARA